MRTILLVSVLLPSAVLAQSPAGKGTNPAAKSDLATTVDALREQVQQLRQAVDDLRVESDRYRQETQSLRQQVQRLTERAPEAAPPAVATGPAEPPRVPERVERVEDDVRLLSGKIDDQYQTKVESGSRYRVRLSGMVVANMFANRGAVDTIDAPQAARPAMAGASGGNFAGTLRQSQIGLEVFGPAWAGANVSGRVQFDFAGGFPETENGVVIGIPRLRTGTIEFAWPHTTVVAGQDVPFFSPASPTSLASLAEPAFSYAGNLWTWVPQVRVEHQHSLGRAGALLLQAGIVDPLSGEAPASTFERRPQAGEASRHPGYATRVSWSGGRDDRRVTFGVGGYASKQDWGFHRTVDSWALTSDWSIPFTRRLALAGEFYRGNAMGGLGASASQSVLTSGSLSNPATVVRGINSMGGWTQLKWLASPTLQFNVAYGQDNPFGRELRGFSTMVAAPDSEVGRNRGTMANFIYRPRSNLLFSTEYRHLSTNLPASGRQSAEHVNLTVGVLF